MPRGNHHAVERHASLPLAKHRKGIDLDFLYPVSEVSHKPGYRTDGISDGHLVARRPTPPSIQQAAPEG